MDSGEKIVLGEDDMRRALTRIAHEIVERNPGAHDGSDCRTHSGRCRPSRRSSGFIGAARILARRLQDQLEDLLDAEVPLGISTSASTAMTSRAGPTHRRARLAHRLRRRRPHGRDRRRRALHRPHRARRDRGSVRLRPSRARAAGRACRPWPSRAADQARLCRQEPADLARRARACARAELDGVDEVVDRPGRGVEATA